MKKIAIMTFGCKINQYESSCIIADFKSQGFQPVEFNEQADIYVINTCTVTNRTDYKSRNAIRKALEQKKIDKNVKVIVTGCYSQRKREEIESIGDVDLIIDNNKKDQIIDVINHHFPRFENILDAKFFAEHSTNEMFEKSRAFVKIQDGCDYYCSYCAIPYARGHSRSRKPEKVLEQITLLAKNGYKEVVLGGINLGLYGLDFEKKSSLSSILQEIEKIDGIEIIRLSSIEPQLFTPELINIISKYRKIASHFHIPLQSGSDEILGLMERKYNTEFFASQISKLSSIRPFSAFGFDVIVGFPGETDELFEETYNFLAALDFTYLHVFSYSVREGTKAEKMKNKIPGNIINKRVKKLEKLSEQKKNLFIDRLLKEKIALKGVNEKATEGIFTALSDRFIRIYADIKNKKDDIIYGIPEKKYLYGVKVR